MVCQELRKFNIKISKDKKEQLVGGKHALIHDLVQQLFDYDQRLVSFSRGASRVQGNHSEMGYGLGDALTDRSPLRSPSQVPGDARGDNLSFLE